MIVDSLWPCIVQIYLIFNVKVGSPVTDLSETLKFGDLEAWLIMVVMDGNRFLIGFEEGSLGARRNMFERPIRYSSARFRDHAVFREDLDVLGFRSTNNTGCQGPINDNI